MHLGFGVTMGGRQFQGQHDSLTLDIAVTAHDAIVTMQVIQGADDIRQIIHVGHRNTLVLLLSERTPTKWAEGGEHGTHERHIFHEISKVIFA